MFQMSSIAPYLRKGARVQPYKRHGSCGEGRKSQRPHVVLWQLMAGISLSICEISPSGREPGRVCDYCLCHPSRSDDRGDPAIPPGGNHRRRWDGDL
jgi:hypothetical protein